MSKTPLGQFVWHETLTKDVPAAQRFYGAVLGWGTAPFDNDYQLWLNGEAPVGGCMKLPPELAASGIPSHWLSYVGTPNVDETVAKAKSLGGAVQHGPMDIPGVGRFAVLSDPFGAVFCVYASATPPPPATGMAPVGDFSWHELATPNPEGAIAFYRSLFGWQSAGEVDMGGGAMYRMFGLGGPPLGGVYRQLPETPVPHWLPYARVSSADTTAEKAKAAGATIAVAPMEVPGGDRIAVLIDPLGATLGVHSTP